VGYHEVRSHYPAAYRVVHIGADNQTHTTADPRPDDLRDPSPTPAVTTRTNMSQIRNAERTVVVTTHHLPKGIRCRELRVRVGPPGRAA
jgi:hypothetical protein